MVTYRYMIGSTEVTEAAWAANKRKIDRQTRAASRRAEEKRKGVIYSPGGADVMDAHDERYKKLYGEKPPPVVEDYRSEEAKKTWPGYRRMQMPDGTWKEGPLRFGSYAEQNAYERTYRFRQTGGSEDPRTKI